MEAGPFRGFLLSFSAAPSAVPPVREAVRAVAETWGLGGLADAAQLAVTELVANVARHAASPDCSVLLRPVRDGLYAEVGDTDPRPPVVREPDWDSESGRGMFLLAHTVDAWGVVPRRPVGKSVWFVLRGLSGEAR
ncbi:ATP-binding protein [Streptomyces sp. SCUT-3]|nr:hypothetical protein C0036_27340 [Streptomyces sp. DJ]QMV25117.1 ATP-binding protein [Streptomyces sp. SCUT-3]